MTFDGSYRRQVREAGEVFTVRRARCGLCQLGDALLPDFVFCAAAETTPQRSELRSSAPPGWSCPRRR
jgi:hypothetical protein